MTAAPAGASVRGLSICPVKGTRVHPVAQVALDRDGAGGDRRFYVVDARARMLNSKVLGALTAVVADLPADDHLILRFPDGSVVEGRPRDGEAIQARFYSRLRDDVRVDGPFSEALTRYLKRPVSLVRVTGPAGAVDRGRQGGVSLISRASLERLAGAAAVDSVDARRFRMTIEVDGVDAHAEDAWVGRRVRVGAAVMRFHGHVGRCLITSRDPETGVVDLPTLDALRAYRGDVAATEPLPFGIYGEVLTPGLVRVGDPVAVPDD